MPIVGWVESSEPTRRTRGRLMPQQVELLIVQVCEFLDVGDAVHRFHGPSRALSRLPGVTVIDIDLHHRLLPELAEICDVLVLAGFDWDFFPLLERRRSAGHITVFEANDYYFDIQPWNPLSARWLDRSIQDSFLQGLLLADAVQTSMPELARRWQLRTPRPIAAFPNQLTEIPDLKPPPQRPLTIGWGGSPGHFADWYQIAPALNRWLAEHPKVHLAVMTNEFAQPFFRLPPERYHFTSFGSLADYLKFLEGLDIGLAPMLTTDYNRCRSDVKFLEYASRGVVGIYADLEPYQGNVVHQQTGLMFRTIPEMIQNLDLLASDQERARKNRLLHAGPRICAEPSDGSKTTSVIAWPFIAGSCPSFPGLKCSKIGCWPWPRPTAAICALRRQQPEQTLLAIKDKPASAESAASAFVQLVETASQLLAGATARWTPGE